MAGIRIEGNVSGSIAEVSTSNHLKVFTEVDAATKSAFIGGTRMFGENDQGLLTGVPYITSPEIDEDYRLRVSQDMILDEEVFNYTAQNTGKHSYANTTLANTWTAGQMTTNSGSITTVNTGSVFNTYACFPNPGTQTLSLDIEMGFSAAPTSNTFIEFGLGIPSTQLVAPADGVFIRMSSTGLQGVISSNGSETVTGVFPLTNGTGTWVYTPNKRYQFIVYVGGIEAEFWVDDGNETYQLGYIALPAGQGRICMSQGMQMFVKHRIVGGAAGGVVQGLIGAYNVRLGGSNVATVMSTMGNRIYGSYQGQSGGTMGTSARYGTITTGNEANPTAAVPTTTTAALGSGLGGHFWETPSLAVNTDGIIMSFQVPAATVNQAGRRLVVRGIGLTSYVQTVLGGGPYVTEWFLAFGHTAVSLATAEAATTKAPRRLPIPAFTQVVAVTQAVSTMISQPGGSYFDLGDAPIFVNPGEFIQLCCRHIGTVGSTGTVVHSVAVTYGWE